MEFGVDLNEYAKAIKEQIDIRYQYQADGNFNTRFFIPIEGRFVNRETERNFGIFAQNVTVETELHVKPEARAFRINLEKELIKDGIYISDFVLLRGKHTPKGYPIPYFWGDDGNTKYKGIFFAYDESNLDAGKPFTVVEKWKPEKNEPHKLKIIQDGKVQLKGECLEDYFMGFMIRK